MRRNKVNGAGLLLLGLCCAGLCASAAGLAEVPQTPGGALTLAGVFGHNMVLQAGRPVPVWGHAKPGVRVEVAFDGKRAETVADTQGVWRVRLDAVEAGGAPGDLTVRIRAGDERITLTNAAVGEVWLASGQSNMEMALRECGGAEAAIREAEDPLLRIINVANRSSETPCESVRGVWQTASPATVAGMSGAAYFFARRLRRRLGVPVGVIQADWGGTPIAAWMPRRTLEEHPLFSPLLDFWDEQLRAYPEKKKAYDAALAAWDAKRKAGQEPGPKPVAPPGPGHRFTPAGLYNGMIHPIAPYAIRGAIWYQGEHDAARAYQYRELFQSMIHDWRTAWGQGDFPFLFVQLPNLGGIPAQPAGGAWAEMREAQAMALRLPATAMAVTYDAGEADQIHPRDKNTVGERLALAALGTVYGHKTVWSGPVYRAMEVRDGSAIITFEALGGGLVTRGGAPLRGFAIAGRDRVFRWAEAEIRGGTVVCRHPQIPEPAAVRYAWDSNPQANLLNREGLPAAPFRTDLWPGRTLHERRGM